MAETTPGTQYVRSVDIDALPRDEVTMVTLANAESGVPSSTVAVFRVAPGKSWRDGPLHTHGHVDQFFFVLSGSLHIEINGVASKLERGMLAYVPAGVPHRDWNEGPEPATYVEFMPGQLRPPGSPPPLVE